MLLVEEADARDYMGNLLYLLLNIPVDLRLFQKIKSIKNKQICWVKTKTIALLSLLRLDKTLSWKI